MKQKQIISFTLFNGMTLLLFASVLSSCQKSRIKHFGHFSSLHESQSRSIASSDEKENSLAKYFDLKQVYIYCHINSVNEKNCFEKHTNEVLDNYEKSHGNKLSGLDLTKNFQKVEKEVLVLKNQILEKMQSDIKKYVNKRTNFCEENSTYYLERCLNQYIESDSVAVLNNYQNHFKNINAQEYIYLLKEIKNDFSVKLQASYQSLNSKEKKS